MLGPVELNGKKILNYTTTNLCLSMRFLSQDSNYTPVAYLFTQWKGRDVEERGVRRKGNVAAMPACRALELVGIEIWFTYRFFFTNTEQQKTVDTLFINYSIILTDLPYLFDQNPKRPRQR